MSRNGNGPGTYLYRLYGADGSLLYIGISGKWLSRMAQHAARKGWWEDVVTIKRESLPSRAEALAAEAAAIREEQPLHNIHWRKPRRVPKPPRVRSPLPAEVYEILAEMRATAEPLPAPDLADLDSVLAHYETARARYLRAIVQRKRLTVLAHQAGWTHEEIGADLGISRARVGQLLKAAP